MAQCVACGAELEPPIRVPHTGGRTGGSSSAPRATHWGMVFTSG